MKYVRETKAAKQISAYVVTRGGREVARVLAYHGGGSCLVNVFQGSKAVEHCAKAAKMPTEGHTAYDRFGFQVGRATGYGYDKFAAALAGLTIDGHAMTDPCGASRKPPKGKALWPRDAKEPKGWSFANYAETPTEAGWQDCYREQGLSYLKAIGYNVLQVL